MVTLSAEYMDNQLKVISLTAFAARYYINTAPDHAEKMSLMAYVGAQKAHDDVWQLVSGNLLAGTSKYYASNK